MAIYDTIDSLVGPNFGRGDAWSDGDHVRGIAAKKREVLLNNLDTLRRELEFSRAFVSCRTSKSTGPGHLSTIRVRNGSLVGITLESIRIDTIAAAGKGDLLLYHDLNKNQLHDVDDPVIGTFSLQPETGRMLFEAVDGILIPNEVMADGSTVPGETLFFMTGAPFERRPRKLHFNFKNAVTGAAFRRQDIWDAVAEADQDSDRALATRSRRELLRAVPNLRASLHETNGTVLPAGEHIFTQNLVIPRGVSLNIEPGTTLTFAQGASLFCFGPLIADGQEHAQIVFQPRDPEAGWGVLAIIGPQRAGSLLRHVRFGAQPRPRSRRPSSPVDSASTLLQPK